MICYDPKEEALLTAPSVDITEHIPIPTQWKGTAPKVEDSAPYVVGNTVAQAVGTVTLGWVTVCCGQHCCRGVRNRGPWLDHLPEWCTLLQRQSKPWPLAGSPFVVVYTTAQAIGTVTLGWVTACCGQNCCRGNRKRGPWLNHRSSWCTLLHKQSEL